ncbi:hypothetical protein [Olivibacter sitiensis]|uniref:hypothetical protein n=1 Tax=Olivibacter sitiensis TaxID=376470 RepID=UPI0004267FEA|nr:hypothetical protein [Olivibacter sitiensis]
MDDFSKQKIIFQEMVQEPSFILDEKGEYMCLDTARIITGKDLDILLAVANSKLFFYSVKTFYGGGGLGETGVRMKHTFFENFPMPILSSEDRKKIRLYVKKPTLQNIKIIDNLLYNAYGLTIEESDYINV